MRRRLLIFILTTLILSSCHQNQEQRTVICIPVYGQSLALGEEADRATDFDSLAAYADGRIITERMDHGYGYFDINTVKQWAKRMIAYSKRDYELSIYRMAQVMADNTGQDTLICIFPGGQGATAIANLSKGTPPYQRFIEDIQTAYEHAQENGWCFIVPAICWMQGESDIVDYPGTDYQQLLTKIQSDMNTDILNITHQKDSIRFICYQPNSLSRAPEFNALNYQCRETEVSQTFVNLLKSDNRFWASGPTYPYTCVGEKIHIDAKGQQAMGLPVIATRRGGIPEEVAPETAILLETDEHFISNLVTDILDLYEHPEKRKQMGAAALERSRMFDKEIYAENFFKALE